MGNLPLTNLPSGGNVLEVSRSTRAGTLLLDQTRGSYTPGASLPAPVPVPNAPQLLAADPEDGSVVVRWVKGTGGSPATGFSVLYQLTGMSTYLLGGTTSSNTLRVSNLTNEVGYKFIVVAHNTSGDSLPSNALAATPTHPAQPPAETGGRRYTVGIYDVETNQMVAMPVADEPYSPERIKWDGLDLLGLPTDPTRTYQARPLSNAADLSVANTWKGVVANNSDSFTGAGLWGSGRPSCVAFRGGRGRYGASYNERGSGHNWFEEAKPGARVKNPGYLTETQSVDAICSDATHTWHAGVSFGDAHNPTTGEIQRGYFISCTVNGPESEYTFTSGETMATETQVYSACDIPGEIFPAIGIAVQQQGNLLLSLHPDKLKIFDKLAGGAALAVIPMERPTAVCLVDETHVSIIHAGKVQLYTLDPAAYTLTPLRPVPLPDGYIPHSQDFSPTDPQHSVLCGGVNTGVTSTATHRIFHFDTRNYDAPPRVEGTGDFAVDINVTDDTFCFFNINDGNPGHCYIAYQEDGSYWFSDDGNKREQHRTKDGALIYTRWCANTTYSPTMVGNDPTRLINGFLEYEIDHSKEKIPANTNNWWKLKYNRCCFRVEGYANSGNNSTTLPNGRTFSLERFNYDYILCEWRTEPPALRYWPNLHIDLTGCMDANGDLLTPTGFYAGEQKRIYRSKLNEYTGDGTPIYNPPVLDAGPVQLAVDTPNSTGMFCGPTADGTYPCFSLAGSPYNLGGIRKGDTKFRFKAAQATWASYQGPFPSKGEYDIGNGVWYGGTMCCVVDDYIVWGYRGERWKNGQTTKFLLTKSDGRYVGQFGTVRDGTFQKLLEDGAPGQGGNALTFRVVKSGTKYILIHGDENNHGGFHLWEFDLSSVVEHPAYPIAATVPAPLPGYDLMGTVPFEYRVGSGVAVGNWQTSGDASSQTSTHTRTSIMFGIGNGGRAWTPFPAGVGGNGYRVAGSFLWGLGGFNAFYYPLAGMQMKDTAGKAYLTLSNTEVDGYTSFKANGKTILRDISLVAGYETYELRPFYVRVAADGALFFSYNGRDEVAIPALPTDPGNPLLPGTLEFNFTAYGVGNLAPVVDQIRMLPA
jgi:hypothetical protein